MEKLLARPSLQSPEEVFDEDDCDLFVENDFVPHIRVNVSDILSNIWDFLSSRLSVPLPGFHDNLGHVLSSRVAILVSAFSGNRVSRNILDEGLRGAE